VLRACLQAAQRILDLQIQLIATTETLRQQATSDALIGLANRPAILKTLEMELNRATRQGASVGVIMIDLDGFKRINDSHGHRIGDAALRQTIQRMQIAIRPCDGFGRHGGEEFLVVLPGCDVTLAGDVAERLCRCVSASPVAMDGKELSMTISAGVGAKSGASGGDADSLIQAADEALYRANAAGRNCVKATWMFACTQP
jgi:diguanylate cyclase (GGDEF)-like protein